MKSTNKNTTDALLHNIIIALRKRGTRCGTGDQMHAIRKRQP
jgi:hypothetical protein